MAAKLNTAAVLILFCSIFQRFRLTNDFSKIDFFSQNDTNFQNGAYYFKLTSFGGNIGLVIESLLEQDVKIAVT
jgi:hypothetical protein